MNNPAARIMAASGWPGRGWSLLAGALIALGLAPFGLWPLALVGLVLAALRGQGADTGKQAAWRGFAVGFGYCLIALNWLVEPFLVNVARHGWMAPFAIGAMASGFGVFWGFGFWLARWLAPLRGFRRTLALAFAWALAEAARSYIFTGFPWALLSQIWIGTDAYFLAQEVGPLGLTLLTLLIAGLFAHGLAGAHAWPLAGAAVLAVASWVAGWGIAQMPPDREGEPAPTIRLVQPNAPQHLKWDPEWREVFFQRQLDFSAAPGSPDLIIWPEVAVTFPLDAPGEGYRRISDAAGPRPVIIGGQRREDGAVFNSMLVLDAEGTPTALYDKHHLVPFGEYIPGGPLARGLGLRGLAQQMDIGFSAGTGADLIEVLPQIRALPMICYEAIFPHELRRVAARPDFLLHLTNDAWFGTFSGPAQHLAQVQARAIEFGLPVIRVANTGISALIDARGRVIAQMPLGEAGHLDAQLPAAHDSTTYWRLGDKPFWAVMIVALSLLLGSRIYNRH